MSEWRDISTAPKDGRWVLLFSPDATADDCAPGVIIGRWCEEDDMPDGGAWWENGASGFSIDADPSHWQPLPAPPVSP